MPMLIEDVVGEGQTEGDYPNYFGKSSPRLSALEEQQKAYGRNINFPLANEYGPNRSDMRFDAAEYGPFASTVPTMSLMLPDGQVMYGNTGYAKTSKGNIRPEVYNISNPISGFSNRSAPFTDANGNGIPDGAEMSQVVTRTGRDGTVTKTTANWINSVQPAMKVFDDTRTAQMRDPFDFVPQSQRGYAALGMSPVQAMTGGSRDTGRIRAAQMGLQQRMGVDAGNVAQANQQNTTRMAALSALFGGGMKLAGDQYTADSNQQAATTKALYEFLSNRESAQGQMQIARENRQAEDRRFDISRNDPRPLGGTAYTQGGQVRMLPTQDAGPISEQVMPNSGATVIMQGGRPVEVIRPQRGDVLDMPPAGGQAQQGGGQLTPEQARAFLAQAGGDKAKARQLAQQAGFTF